MKVCQTCSRRYPDNALRCPEDGRDLVPLTPSGASSDGNLVGRRMFGDYVLEKKLGEGGMGAVYQARNTAIDQSIAIKVLHGRAAEDSELVQRFNREARTIAKLTHPNIIRVFIFGHTDDGLSYLAMEYVDGGSLRALIESSGSLAELHAIYIIKQVLAAVSEAHDLGIIHRDLKPDNILLTEHRGNTEFVKVVDFGIAKVSEPDNADGLQLTQAGVVYGTPEYLSPEQAQALPLDHRSDLYSVGVIFWEMVTGKLPYEADTAMAVLVRHAFDPPPDPDEVEVPLSDGVKGVLRSALAKKPSERFQSAEAFLSALDECERELGGKTQLWMPPPDFDEYVADAASEQPPSSSPPPFTPRNTQTELEPGPMTTLSAAVAPPSDVTTGRKVVMGLIGVGLVLLLALGIAIIVVTGNH